MVELFPGLLEANSLNKHIITLCFLLAACAADTGRNNSVMPAATRLFYPYEFSDSCGGCHSEIYAQYRDSMHAKSFSNQLFNTLYFNEIVPRALQDRTFTADARKCLMCHAPVVYMNYTGLVSTTAQAGKYESGVTCDFCHTLAGYAENGDYLQNSSGKKQGPPKAVSDLLTPRLSHHAEDSGFFQMAEYCGRCHNATSHNGLKVKSTFDEWRESNYAKQGLVCQECHMNKNGLLKNGVAEFDSGVFTHLNLGGTAIEQKQYKKLYTHSFPGAHSLHQLEKALHIELQVDAKSVDANGRLAVKIDVNNERSGHKMPSGSSDLRFMWLSVSATSDDGTSFPAVLFPSEQVVVPDYSIAGTVPQDAAILGNDVPFGSRLYRSVFVDAQGHQSLFHYDAERNIFDNRLNAAEVRSEVYELTVPPGYSGHITLSASLSYQSAPSSFTRHVQVADFKPVVIASVQKKITLVAPSAAPLK